MSAPPSIQRIEREDNVFHAHLDVCRQCRERPFDLCPLGALTLKIEVERAAKALPGFEMMFGGPR